MHTAQEILTTINDDPDFLEMFLTDAEWWVFYGYDVETKAQSSQWQHPEEPRPLKARQVQSNMRFY